MSELGLCYQRFCYQAENALLEMYANIFLLENREALFLDIVSNFKRHYQQVV